MSRSGKYNNAFEATWNGIVDMFSTRDRVSPLTPEERLDGATVLVSGASKGLGLATSVELAKLGAHVIMGCRTGIPEKGEYVKRESGSGLVNMIPMDLADFNKIDAFVDQLEESGYRPDIVICNAAMVPSGARRTPQGLEEMFMVNYLSKFYLIQALLKRDLLGRSRGIPRIIFVSSESHRNPERFEWDTIGTYQDYSMGAVINRYGYFKLLLTTFARELSRRYGEGSSRQIEVRALCPGPVNTSIAREAPSIFKPLLKVVFGLFFKSPKDACEPVVYFTARQSDDYKEFDYLYLMSERPIDPKAEDPENGQKLWEISTKLVNEYHHSV